MMSTGAATKTQTKSQGLDKDKTNVPTDECVREKNRYLYRWLSSTKRPRPKKRIEEKERTEREREPPSVHSLPL